MVRGMKFIFCVTNIAFLLFGCSQNYIKQTEINQENSYLERLEYTLNKKIPNVVVNNQNGKKYYLSAHFTSKSLVVAEWREKSKQIDSSLTNISIQLEEYNIAQKPVKCILLIVSDESEKIDLEHFQEKYKSHYKKVLFISEKEALRINCVQNSQTRYVFDVDGLAQMYTNGDVGLDSIEMELANQFGLVKNSISFIDFEAICKEFYQKNRSSGITEAMELEFGQSLLERSKKCIVNKYLPNFQVTNQNQQKIDIYNILNTNSYIFSAKAHCSFNAAFLEDILPKMIKTEKYNYKFIIFYLMDEIAKRDSAYVKNSIANLKKYNPEADIYFIDDKISESINFSFWGKYKVNKNKKVEAILLANELRENYN